VSVTVTNEIGCTLTKSIYINCPEPEENPCDEAITVAVALETVSYSLDECLGKVNVVYDLDPVPPGYIIDVVTLTVSVDGGVNTIIGGSPVVATFNSLTGVKTIDLDYSAFCNLPIPIPVPTNITLDININILFVDACEYETNFELEVNPRLLGDYDSETILVNP
jgi:hypothetical protein